MIKIAVAGRIRSGKDTVVDLIEEELSKQYQVERFAFADKLKYYAHEICFDIPKEPKPRELYQAMNLFRTIDPLVWVKHLEKDLNKSHSSVQIITDLRQENEAKFCRENGFVIIKVTADTEIRKARVLNAGETWNEEFEQHPSEIEIDGMNTDYTITNNTTLEDLKESVLNVLNVIQKDLPVSTSNELNIYTDGACSNNQEKVNTGGWGYAHIVDNHCVRVGSARVDNTTNNQMELKAVIEGLKSAKTTLKDYEVINIYTDSNYVLKGITEWIEGWKRNNWVNSSKKPVANKELWVELDSLKTEIQSSVELQWHKVKGHSGDKWNEFVDDLATGRA